MCITRAGSEGTCRLPSSCIGATIKFLEDNECSLPEGGVGTCCVPVPVDNIINIIDSPQQTVEVPNSVDNVQVGDLLTRSGFSSVAPKDTSIRFASEEPAEDVVVDTNFVDDPSPSEFHLR